MEETLSLQEILKIIKKRLWLIISLTTVAVAIAVALNLYYITPSYQAQTQILVNQKANNQEGIWSQNEIDLQLINTYSVIITSSAILSKVIDELDLNSTPEQLMHKITVSSESDSKVINITITDQDHQQAVDIANTVVTIFKKEIPNLMSVDNINILSEAQSSDNPRPVKPNKMLNIAIGTVIGLMMGIGLAFLLEILNTKIKDEKDVEEILDIPIMGVVCSIPLEKQKKSFFKSKKVRSNKDAWNEH